MEYLLEYDETNPISIETYGKRLIGKTFQDICDEDDMRKAAVVRETENYEVKHENKKRKGGLGELVEERYFHYQSNNDARPDFDKAGVELKVTPYKINKNGSISAKERLILTMIDYCKVVNESFEESHMWAKARLILLVYYLYRQEIKNRLDYKIDYVQLFSPPEEDMKIIEHDFNVIKDKICAGKAHELSEGDPIELPFTIQEPILLNNAIDKYQLHKELIDQLLNALKGSFHVGYVRRQKKYIHGISANSLNEAIREKLKGIPGIEGETNVVFGTFLPPVKGKGEFDFSIYNKETNFYKLWDYCYGENAIRDGDLIVDKYIKDNKLRQKWDKFCVKQKNDEHKIEMNSAHNTFNILGEIQFGNWAMVYKDMFRLVSAINKNAQIDLYIYIAATDNLKKIISDGVVGVNAARERFQENIDNHNINKPVMIVPLDIDFDLDTYDFSEAEKGYDEISREIQELEQKISCNKKKITVLNDKKKNADSEKAKIIKEEIKDLRNEKKHNQQELDELKNLYKISDEIEEI